MFNVLDVHLHDEDGTRYSVCLVDVKIHWLQPPYSAAGCSQLIYEKLYITGRCCSILAAASRYEF